MSQERSKELEKLKWRVLSNIIERSVLPPAEALNGVPGQKAIVALEIFLHEAFRLIREELLLKYLLPKIRSLKFQQRQTRWRVILSS